MSTNYLTYQEGRYEPSSPVTISTPDTFRIYRSAQHPIFFPDASTVTADDETSEEEEFLLLTPAYFDSSTATVPTVASAARSTSASGPTARSAFGTAASAAALAGSKPKAASVGLAEAAAALSALLADHHPADDFVDATPAEVERQVRSFKCLPP